ncbi:hypothetical protein [Neobacillus sp.]|uniref:hypothetical protein n=1 Tax=Neobacillus sp. TaxID=2675273 RepID=UPI0028A2C3F8|nr:hypothetical protein [Neobacillus sp.]
MRPRRRWKRRGGSPNRPRKAKRLERKSTAKFNVAKQKRLSVNPKFFEFVDSLKRSAHRRTFFIIQKIENPVSFCIV